MGFTGLKQYTLPLKSSVIFVFHLSLSLFSHCHSCAQGYETELCEPAVFFKSSTNVKNGLTQIQDYNSQETKNTQYPSGTGCFLYRAKKIALRNLARLKIMKDPLQMYCVSEISIECSHNHWTWDFWDDNGPTDLDWKENPGAHSKHTHTQTEGVREGELGVDEEREKERNKREHTLSWQRGRPK